MAKRLKEVMEQKRKPSMADVTLDQLMTFLETGNLANAPEELVLYVNALDAIRGMSIRIDLYPNKDRLINEIMFLYDVPKMTAIRLYSEMVEYFYADTKISKDAYRNKYADMQDKLINFGLLTMKSVEDAVKVSKMIKEVVETRQLMVADEKVIGDELYRKPVTVMTVDGNMFEMGMVNREELMKEIEGYNDLSEKEKSKLRQDAMIEPIKVFEH
jgi:hypothetical protein